MPISSSPDSRSPSSSAVWISALSRSSPGLSRLSASRPAMYAVMAWVEEARTDGSMAETA
ncbi:hypothetical protein SBADM41S_08217 [Streptomyces badius]